MPTDWLKSNVLSITAIIKGHLTIHWTVPDTVEFSRAFGQYTKWATWRSRILYRPRMGCPYCHCIWRSQTKRSCVYFSVAFGLIYRKGTSRAVAGTAAPGPWMCVFYLQGVTLCLFVSKHWCYRFNIDSVSIDMYTYYGKEFVVVSPRVLTILCTEPLHMSTEVWRRNDSDFEGCAGNFPCH